jgi:ketosteroid isomerase-like protein
VQHLNPFQLNTEGPMRVTLSLPSTALVLAVGSLSAPVAAIAQSVTADDPALPATLEKMDAAHVAFHNGNPEPSIAVWSHASDVTLTGGAGGAIEQGWEHVRPRLEWASAQYSKGRQQNERVSVTMSGDLALVVQYEHIWFHAPREERESERRYRVTAVLRGEAGRWRVIHRHADTMMERVTPR